MSSPEAQEVAREVFEPVLGAAATVEQWRQAHPDIADYRIEAAFRALSSAVTELRKLVDGVDPEFDAAVRKFRGEFGLDGPEE